MTRKEILATNTYVLKVGYCQLETLLTQSNREPYAYTCGVYGWNSDIYSIGNVAISTGYRPCGNINCSFELVSKYEELAQSEYVKYNNTKGRNYDKYRTTLADLLHSFIDEAIATNGKGYENVKVKEHFQFN